MNIASKKETIKLLKENNLIAKKNYGQNFLINYKTVQNIMELIVPNQQELIIEIGPGLGALTQVLLESNAKVIAIEIDKRLANLLKNTLGYSKNLEIINEDILKIDLNSIIDKQEEYSKITVVSNLPYYITSDILEKLITTQNSKIKKIVVMMQKEVAKKILKKEDKIESYLKILTQNYCTIKRVLYVSKNDFYPRPKVDSMVLEVLLDSNKNNLDMQKLESIKGCLKNKRKMLINTLPFIDKEKTKEVFKSLKIRDTIRAEELSLKELLNILESLNK